MTRHGIGTFVVNSEAAETFRIRPDQIGTLDEVLTVLELRIAVESEAAALAALRRTDEGSDQLSGATSGEGTLIVREGTYSFTGTISSPALSAGGFDLGAARASIVSDFSSLSLDAVVPALATRIEGRIGLVAPRPVDAARAA